MTTPDPNAAPDQPTPPPSSPPSSPPVVPPGARVAPPAEPPEEHNIERLPRWAQELYEAERKKVADLSKENSERRVAAREAAKAEEKIRAALLALGISTEETDPAKIAEAAQRERDAARAELARAQREAAVFRLAGTAGAEPGALLDSRTFMDSVTSIDPADAAAITEAIKAAVAANPRLAAVAPPAAPPVGGASGGDFAGGPGTGQQLTREQLATMSDAQIMKAYSEGRLASVVAAR